MLRTAVVHPAGIVFGLFQDVAPVFPIAAVYISKQAVMGKGGMMRAELILIAADQVSTFSISFMCRYQIVAITKQA